MSGIQLYHNETLFSTTFLRRLQVPTDRRIDSCCTALIQLFIERYGDKIDEIVKLCKTELDDVDKYLTVVVTNEELGVSSGKNHPRAVRNLKLILKAIREKPYIIYETTGSTGIRIYAELPLVKYSSVDEKGNCKIIFNDALRYHVSSSLPPSKRFGCCPLDIKEEIKDKNIYASIIFEEACSWECYGNRGKNPFFNWSLSELRQKFSFDYISSISEDGKAIVTFPVKIMRIDNLIKDVLNPALVVLEEFYNQGKTKFWLEMTSYFSEAKRVGRPPKDCFHFIIHREKKDSKSLPSQDAVQENLFSDAYIELNTLYYIKEELNSIILSKKLVNKIVKQIEKGEFRGSQEDVLSKIKNLKSNYKHLNRYERGNKVLIAIGIDFGLGDTSKLKVPYADISDSDWPDSIDGQIKALMDSPEIKDLAVKDFDLSTQDVDRLLCGAFLQNCLNQGRCGETRSKGVGHFFNWLKCMNIRGPLNNVDYENKQYTNNTMSNGTKQNNTDGAVQTILDFFNEPA